MRIVRQANAVHRSTWILWRAHQALDTLTIATAAASRSRPSRSQTAPRCSTPARRTATAACPWERRLKSPPRRRSCRARRRCWRWRVGVGTTPPTFGTVEDRPPHVNKGSGLGGKIEPTATIPETMVPTPSATVEDGAPHRVVDARTRWARESIPTALRPLTSPASLVTWLAMGQCSMTLLMRDG